MADPAEPDDPEDREDITARLDEAEALLTALWHTSDDRRQETLLDWVRALLAPLVAADDPRAIWMNAGLLGLDTGLTEAAYDAARLAAMRTAADGGCAEARFALGHWHYEREQFAAATALYKQAADAGHAYAKWCYGLDRIGGVGGPADPAEGLRHIREAADLWFEGALRFMADAHALGQYGLAKDDAEAARWHGKLHDRRVIRY